LPAWRPVPTYISTMILFLIFGIIFLTLGVIMYKVSNSIFEKSIPYDSDCNKNNNTKCNITFNIIADTPIN
jgi:exopolysaccharide biosynthesis protein